MPNGFEYSEDKDPIAPSLSNWASAESCSNSMAYAVKLLDDVIFFANVRGFNAPAGFEVTGSATEGWSAHVTYTNGAGWDNPDVSLLGISFNGTSDMSTFSLSFTNSSHKPKAISIKEFYGNATYRAGNGIWSEGNLTLVPSSENPRYNSLTKARFDTSLVNDIFIRLDDVSFSMPMTYLILAFCNGDFGFRYLRIYF